MKKLLPWILALLLMGWVGSCFGDKDCSYTGCDRSVYKNGWCYDHYVYASITGDFY